MLSKEEEQRLENDIEIMSTDSWDSPLFEYTESRWLISRVKELNEELKTLTAQNIEFAEENSALTFLHNNRSSIEELTKPQGGAD